MPHKTLFYFRVFGHVAVNLKALLNGLGMTLRLEVFPVVLLSSFWPQCWGAHRLKLRCFQ